MLQSEKWIIQTAAFSQAPRNRWSPLYTHTNKKKQRKWNGHCATDYSAATLGALFSTNNLDGWKILHGHIAEEQSNDTHVVAQDSGRVALKSEAWDKPSLFSCKQIYELIPTVRARRGPITAWTWSKHPAGVALSSKCRTCSSRH